MCIASQLLSLWLDGPICIIAMVIVEHTLSRATIGRRGDLLADGKEPMCSILSGLLEFSPLLLRYFISGMGSLLELDTVVL